MSHDKTFKVAIIIVVLFQVGIATVVATVRGARGQRQTDIVVTIMPCAPLLVLEISEASLTARMERGLFRIIARRRLYRPFVELAIASTAATTVF